MKNLGFLPIKNGPKRCKTSEVFCKPANLQNNNINEINDLRMTRKNHHHDVQMTCKTLKTQQKQPLTRFEDIHCRHLSLTEIERQYPLTRYCLSDLCTSVSTGQERRLMARLSDAHQINREVVK
jgi:hypothetical protein